MLRRQEAKMGVKERKYIIKGAHCIAYHDNKFTSVFILVQ